MMIEECIPCDGTGKLLARTVSIPRWPPVTLTERDALVCQFWREGVEEYQRTQGRTPK